MSATLNALHCYVVHKTKQLFRLQRENNTTHFITAIDDNDDKFDQKDENVKSNAITSIKFGVSVLEWLKYNEKAKFRNFHEEIVCNDESTINEALFLNISQECFIKMSQRKYEQFTLQELLSLKIYTDTNSYQSALRKSFWNSTPVKIKKSFFHWASQIYSTSLYHSEPIPRWNSRTPSKIYHGLDRVFTLDTGRPLYNGPVSTSLTESVAHTFSNGTGTIWTIKAQYSNKFKFVKGICVSWISQHKHEDEVLLVNQYIPIESTRNFDDDINNNVDHLLYSLKSYKKKIVNKKRFYRILGIFWKDSWLSIIKNHEILCNETSMGPSITVMHRLINELNVTELKELDQYCVLSTKYETFCHTVFDYCSIKINDIETCVTNKCFSNSVYKITGCDIDKKKFELPFKYNDEIVLKNEKKTLHKSYTIWVGNEQLFRVKDFIPFQDLHINMRHDLNSKIFHANLKKVKDYMISLSPKNIDQAYRQKILKCEYALITNSKQQQITERDMTKNNYVYKFDDIDKMQFLIPFTTNLSAIGLYVQPKDKFNFVLFKRFYPKYTSKTNVIQYLLTILELWPHSITSPVVFFKQVGIKWNDMWIPSIKKRLMESMDKETTTSALNRFINELNINEFPNLSLSHINIYTLRQLTHILTHQDVANAANVAKTTDVLLLCHVLFSNSIDLLDLLVERFHATNKYRVKSNVCLLLTQWIQIFWHHDFIALPTETMKKLDSIFASTVSTENKETQMILAKLKQTYQLQQLPKFKNRTVDQHNSHNSHNYSGMNIADTQPLMLAEQFTLIHFAAFKAIHKRELLIKSSGQSDDKIVVPNLSNMSTLFEQTIKWVKLFILNEPHLKKRTKKKK
eukprot:32336_1